ncbi:MAG: ribonuclease HI family protein [Nanoarchaeota archaeon]
MKTLFIDGLCEPINPGGVAAIGYVIDARQYGAVIGYGQGMTNNVAEYRAAIKSLEDLVGTEEELLVCSDSQLLVRQLTGRYAVHSSTIFPHYQKILELQRQFQQVQFEWIPREKNTLADALCWKAYEDFLDQNPGVANLYQAHWASKPTQVQLQLMGLTRKYVGERTARRLMAK